MNEQEKVHITIFQAPFASLMDFGLYMKMHDSSRPFSETVPAKYYLAVFDGVIECPNPLPKDKEQRTYTILEKMISIFNNNLPAGYCSRSLSVGDVVQLEGLHYLCVACGFRPVIFTTSQRSTAATEPQACTLTMPDGTVLRATAHPEPEYPYINVDLIAALHPKMQGTMLSFTATWVSNRRGSMSKSSLLRRLVGTAGSHFIS